MDETLEPIQPITDTPYGGMVIGYDVLCTPTSLCTWKETKPVVYCKLPQHTLNPVCKKTNQGIGLIGCYDEPTCGGMTRLGETEKILLQNPQYKNIIQKEEEQKLLKKNETKSNTIMVIVVIIILLVAVVVLFYHFYPVMIKKKKRRRRRSAKP